MVKLGENFVHWNRLLRTEKEGIHPPFPQDPWERGGRIEAHPGLNIFPGSILPRTGGLPRRDCHFHRVGWKKLGFLRPVFKVKQPYWLEIENPTQTRESKKMIVWFLHPECLQVGRALSDSPAHSSEIYLWPRQRGALKPLAFRIWLKDIHWLLQNFL